jgi:hypothetical protein
MKSHALVIALCLTFANAALAGPEGHHQAPAMPKEFDTLKALLGKWEGTSDMGKGKQKMTVTYELTSGGTAISEKMVSGPMQMLTVYHKEGNSLGMTHFCAMGNSPRMHLKSAEGNKLAFEMTGAEGVSSMEENHMHALTLTMNDKNTLTQDWTNMESGKSQSVSFKLKRKK